MALELKTPPAGEPLSLAETQSYLKTTDPSETDWINNAIQAVRESCEGFTRRALKTQTWILWLDAFQPAHSQIQEIEIPRAPLQSITHVKTYNKHDEATTLDATHYLMDTSAVPGRLILREGYCWPTDLRIARAVEIEFVAGFGDASDVPAGLRQGMLLWIRLLYANKTWLLDSGVPVPGLTEFNSKDLPLPVRALWDPYRLPRLG
ncbi:MAG: hypothetical protein G3M70_06010 [Candidatus Nitronauta litoralis]|uniref:Phage gp6-like head-tail connector protein n=1 Tax=Candidatus Nitronauta litoralis TaxID=2705533 RepID=A0A7T0BUW0_9BACT|nr:MAG: hypothetical protein G3M70_06010 [Candidatus Nitronauta litoralis]